MPGAFPLDFNTPSKDSSYRQISVAHDAASLAPQEMAKAKKRLPLPHLDSSVMKHLRWCENAGACELGDTTPLRAQPPLAQHSQPWTKDKRRVFRHRLKTDAAHKNQKLKKDGVLPTNALSSLTCGLISKPQTEQLPSDCVIPRRLNRLHDEDERSRIDQDSVSLQKEFARACMSNAALIAAKRKLEKEKGSRKAEEIEIELPSRREEAKGFARVSPCGFERSLSTGPSVAESIRRFNGGTLGCPQHAVAQPASVVLAPKAHQVSSYQVPEYTEHDSSTICVRKAISFAASVDIVSPYRICSPLNTRVDIAPLATQDPTENTWHLQGEGEQPQVSTTAPSRCPSPTASTETDSELRYADTDTYVSCSEEFPFEHLVSSPNCNPAVQDASRNILGDNWHAKSQSSPVTPDVRNFNSHISHAPCAPSSDQDSSGLADSLLQKLQLTADNSSHSPEFRLQSPVTFLPHRPIHCHVLDVALLEEAAKFDLGNGATKCPISRRGADDIVVPLAQKPSSPTLSSSPALHDDQARLRNMPLRVSSSESSDIVFLQNQTRHETNVSRAELAASNAIDSATADQTRSFWFFRRSSGTTVGARQWLRVPSTFAKQSVKNSKSNVSVPRRTSSPRKRRHIARLRNIFSADDY